VRNSLRRKTDINEEDGKPSNAAEALLDCNQGILPNAKNLLQILATFPVSTATAE